MESYAFKLIDSFLTIRGGQVSLEETHPERTASEDLNAMLAVAEIGCDAVGESFTDACDRVAAALMLLNFGATDLRRGSTL